MIKVEGIKKEGIDLDAKCPRDGVKFLLNAISMREKQCGQFFYFLQLFAS